MSGTAPLGGLTARLALLSSISFGGIPSVLPDIRHFVVVANAWLTDQEFSDFFAIAQAIPGPNMLLMMSLIGWKVAGFPGALASAGATFGPPCTMYFFAYRVWNRFRDARWQKFIRAGLAPLTIGLIIAGGTVMARATDADWRALLVTGTCALIALMTRINPLWLLAGAGTLGALDFL